MIYIVWNRPPSPSAMWDGADFDLEIPNLELAGFANSFSIRASTNFREKALAGFSFQHSHD